MFPIEVCLVCESGEIQRTLESELTLLDATISQRYQSIGECYAEFEKIPRKSCSLS